MTFRLPLADRPDLVRYVNGEPVLSAKAMSYLFGVTEQDVLDHHRQNAEGSAVPWPKAWVRQGKEITARLGVDNLSEALTLLIAEREKEPPA